LEVFDTPNNLTGLGNPFTQVLRNVAKGRRDNGLRIVGVEQV